MIESQTDSITRDLNHNTNRNNSSPDLMSKGRTSKDHTNQIHMNRVMNKDSQSHIDNKLIPNPHSIKIMTSISHMNRCHKDHRMDKAIIMSLRSSNEILCSMANLLNHTANRNTVNHLMGLLRANTTSPLSRPHLIKRKTIHLEI